ncbi:uncharacterized protein LOC135373586 [Ornithodoros turicata]|uniref:uncharacterized protein LOC135373586 n=1 Tax=Ornithodoros turicata TaxID=34597 RepID=UPI0031399020
MYAVLDDQSNRSLARPAFFDVFGVQGDESPYTLKTCAGAVESSGRRASGYVVESIDGRVRVPLPTLIECMQIPDDRNEIPTPEVAHHHPHLKKIAGLIPPLTDDAEILLLLGRDVLQVHKVRQQLNGPNNAPYAQRLDLGWVVVGDVCINGMRKPDRISTFTTTLLENGRASTFTPCPSHVFIKENVAQGAAIANLTSMPAWSCDTLSYIQGLGDSVFETSKDDNKLAPSIEDKQFLEIMNKTFTKDEANSWVAPLPFRTRRSPLPDNREQARIRFASLCRTLDKRPDMKEHFFTFMGNIFANGHAELAPERQEGKEVWYLPIFGVYHPKKPEQIRVVFDSSAKFQGTSLNDVLLTGPNLGNSLLGVLIRFRKEPFAITADIQQMFYCFIVREEDREYLRFLWFRDNDTKKDVVGYRMCVHVFGNSPSPAVATYGLKRTALEGEREYGTDARRFVERDFYVDDGLKSLPTEEAAIDLLQRTKDMLAVANLRLHKIASNSVAVMKAFPSEEHAKDLKDLDLGTDSPPTQRSLGLSWNIKHDAFTFHVPPNKKPHTRRGLLSTVNSLYDPLGFATPVTVRGRLLLRELSTLTEDWDVELPQSSEWEVWRDSLSDLEDIEIPRTYSGISLATACRKELCIFSDASTEAIAAVAYLKLTDARGHNHVGFILGKAKLAPKRGHTIPRLELCGAVLAVEMADVIISELDVCLDEVKFYTDSKVVLGYIYNESRRFYVYVSNRVERIRKSCQPKQWNYVPTEQNPADIATRAVSADRLAKTTWLTGPNVLYKTDDSGSDFECQTFRLIDPEADEEVRPVVTTLATSVSSQRRLGAHRFERFSRWTILIRTIANLLHIARSFHSRGDTASVSCRHWHICLEPRTNEELSAAKKLVYRTVQGEMFSSEIRCIQNEHRLPRGSPLWKLNPYMDEDGVMRIGGRLQNSTLDQDERHHVIMPRRHHITTLLVRHHHERVEHQGCHFTEGALRAAGLWIVGAKSCIGSMIHKCVKCRKLRSRPQKQSMADLPRDRLSMDPPFTYVGLDVFGPWKVKARRTRGGLAHSKRWAVLFTCLSVRAIHIEVIESMDSSSFINALRRFLSIRGPVKLLRSDCGTNFVGACKELKINTASPGHNDVGKYLQTQECTWVFNPPHASHMGGAWERMIGIVRRIVDSVLLGTNKSMISHDMLVTLFAEIAAIVNSRPLTPVSTDPENPTILTPSMILTQKTGINPPPP